jgi:hypothetical protein
MHLCLSYHSHSSDEACTAPMGDFRCMWAMRLSPTLERSSDGPNSRADPGAARLRPIIEKCLNANTVLMDVNEPLLSSSSGISWKIWNPTLRWPLHVFTSWYRLTPPPKITHFVAKQQLPRGTTGRNVTINLIVSFNSILYYLCAKPTATRPVTDTAQCRYK